MTYRVSTTHIELRMQHIDKNTSSVNYVATFPSRGRLGYARVLVGFPLRGGSAEGGGEVYLLLINTIFVRLVRNDWAGHRGRQPRRGDSRIARLYGAE